ncbi:unnamed protein product [Camellia sinensis]
MKDGCGLASDIISHLPDNVKETILMCLPIQDAVRTSVLSRKWRYIWVKLPQLVFDYTFYKNSFWKTKNELVMIIYQVLLLHHGPILKFTLSLPKLESCFEIDQLIYFASKNGTQEFTLRIWTGTYKLPSSLFSCLQLKHLNLHSCMFKPPPEFKGFSGLLSLELREVVITADILSSLISSCLLLERLTVESSTSFEPLEIAAPNLRFLRCKGLFSSICFKNTPQLARVSIYLNKEVLMEGESSNSVMFFGSLPVVEFLELNGYYVMGMAAGKVPKMLPTTLSHLKILELNDICFGEPNEVSIVLCLIRSSPNLAKIKIEACTRETTAIDPVLELLVLLEMQDGWGVYLNQLREVEMRNLSGIRFELDLIKLLLAKSPMLERMLIEPNSEVVLDKGLRILKKLTRFQRLSPQAQITYYDPDEDSEDEV